MNKPLVKTLVPGLVFGVALGISACVATGTRDLPADMAAAAKAASLDDYVLVDCLLPGQIRQLGTRMTYLAPRRSIKATRRDCGIRGGEYVLFDRSDYANALKSLLPQAERGDPVAQSYVGEIYEKGLGLPAPDLAAAARWYRKAAEQGNTDAQVSLGSLYERGAGVPADKAEALNWYRRATGITEDRLAFESSFRAEREAFQREIALRNQVAASLKAQLRQARSAPARPAPAAKPKPGAGAPAKPKAGVSAAAPAANASASAAAPAAGPDPAAVARLIESQQRDAQRQAELREKALHAVRTVKESAPAAAGGADAKAAQAGKLELSLRQEISALRSTAQQLAAATP